MIKMRLRDLLLFLLALGGIVNAVQQLNEDFPFQKNLWLYWHDNLQNASPTIQLCYEKYKQVTKKTNFQLIVLNRTNLRDYINDFQQNFQKVINNSKQTQVANIADLIRLLVLQQHGGIWVDFSSVFFEGLDWLQDLMHGKYDNFITNKFSPKPQALLFYYGNFQNRIEYRLSGENILYNEYPGYEIWWIAVRKQCQFIKDLRVTFSKFTQLSYDRLESLFIQDDIYIHNQDDSGAYLAENMAVTYIMQKKQKELDRNMTLISDRKTAFQEYKIWGLHGELGPLAFCRKERTTELDCFDKTIQEIKQDVMPLMFFVKLVRAVRVLFDEKLNLLIETFVKKNLNFQQFLSQKPTLQTCQSIKLIINGSVMSNLLQKNPFQQQKLKLPIFTIQQRDRFNKYCYELNHNKPFPLDTSQTSYFDHYISSRGQRSKIQEIQRISSPSMNLIQWIIYQWNINSFLLKVIIIVGLLIPLLFFVFMVVFNLLRRCFQTVMNKKSTEKKQSMKKKSIVYLLNWVRLVVSVGYFLVVDIFGGKDQSFCILLVVLFVILVQTYIKQLKGNSQKIKKPPTSHILKKDYQIELPEQQLQKSSSKINLTAQSDHQIDFQTGLFCLVNQVNYLIVSYFITYLSLGVVRKHKFLQMFYSYIIGVIGPCLFRFIELIYENNQHENKKNSILVLLMKVSKQDIHKIILVAFLVMVNLMPNAKYLVGMSLSGKDQYFLAQMVIYIPLTYLFFVAIFTFYQLIKSSMKTQLLRLTLLCVSIFLVYLGKDHLIIVLTEFRIVWILIMTLVAAFVYVQIGEELIMIKDNTYEDSTLTIRLGEILLFMAPLCYEFLFGTLCFRLDRLKSPQISISQIFFLLLSISSIIIYKQFRRQPPYSITSQDEENSSLNELSERKR